MVSESEMNKIRLSDRILSALELALEQDDVKVCEALVKSLDLSMTRNTGGGEFIERRDYPPQLEDAMDKFYELKDKLGAI